MKAALTLLLVLSTTPAVAAPLRVFIRAGAKTHGPGQHDHPRFLTEWKALLASRGAVADGALRFPTAEELARTDVLVVFAPDGGKVAPDERKRLQAFLDRGGGVVALHDAVVSSDDPHWWKTVIGGAWENGRSKFHEGKVGLYYDRAHPITAGLANHFLDDEIYWDLHLAPGAKVLANGFRTVQEITPQVWVYEPGKHRAFVSLQGHEHRTFSLPHQRALVLRGIAWAGRRPVDALVSRDELAALRYPPGGPTPPARALDTMVLHPEFEIALVAAEPDVVKPIAMDWDARGRLWVAQLPGYPEKAAVMKTTPRDSIAVFTDRDGDGRWDQRSVFCDGLDLLTGFVLHRDGAIVSTPPEILFLRDTDGDGRCDRREVLFGGFGIHDTHATVSNLRWGMDGWVYATQGYSGNQSNVTGPGGTAFGKIGNGLFRFRPDGSAIEVVSAYGANTWGLDFAWDGELFFTMANESHLRHVVLPEPALARGKVGQTPSWKQIVDHRDSRPIVSHTLNPYVQIDCVGGFTAASGSTVYDGGAWPEKWRMVHFVSEPTVNLVHVDRIGADAATYKAGKLGDDEFLASKDLWFRPVDARVGPDGALYLADFYNLAAIHNDTRGPPHGPFNAAVRPDRDHEHGRLWRIQHRQATKLARPRLEGASAAELVAALSHPNRWHRQTAQRLLAERGEGAKEAGALLGDRGKPAHARVHALWTLQQLGAVAPAQLVAALADPEPALRKNAARIAAQGPVADRALVAALLRGVGDAEPRARLEALVALGRAPASPALTRAVVSAYPRLGDEWSRSAAVGAAATAPVQAIAAALAGPPAISSLIEALTRAVGERQDGALAASLVRTIAARGGASALRQAALARLVEALRPETKLPASAAPAVQALLASPDLGVAAAALPLASRGGTPPARLEPLVGRLLAALGDGKRDPAARLALLRALLHVPAASERATAAAGRLLADATASAMHRPIIEALGSSGEPKVAPALIAAFPHLAGPARDLAVAQLLKRADWSRALVAELEARRLRPTDLGPQALFRLRKHPDGAVAAEAAQVIDAVAGTAAKEKDEIIARLLPVVQRPGDRARGHELFTQNCAGCHTYKGEGRHVAPELDGMGARGPAELLVHVIDPNRAVEPNFAAVDVTTRQGAALNGIVARETADAILLRNATGDVEVERADIKTLATSGLSLMPEGFEALGGEALRDLLAYLCFDDGRFRTVDLTPVATASTRGLYGKEGSLRVPFGVQNVEGIPFQIADPGRSLSGHNAVVLGPGAKVDVTLGFSVEKLHVLGGIAGQGATEAARAGKGGDPVVKVTYHYADGRTEQALLRDGVEFAAWSSRVDVPGSRYVPGLVAEGTRGQVRRFALQPSRREAVHHVTLEAAAAKMPTFLALTAEVAGAAKADGPRVLIVGGGSSHDFDRHFRDADLATLSQVTGRARYTSKPDEVAAALAAADVLVLTNNQPLPGPARAAVMAFVERGGGLVVVHPAAWYNWKDWPEYNRKLVGGGSRGHEKYGEFAVKVVDPAHPVTRGVAAAFTIKDELYRHERDPAGPAPKVLAVGRSDQGATEHPVVWTHAHGKGRVVVITLGHDGAAHEHAAYRALLRNAVTYVAAGAGTLAAGGAR